MILRILALLLFINCETWAEEALKDKTKNHARYFKYSPPLAITANDDVDQINNRIEKIFSKNNLSQIEKLILDNKVTFDTSNTSARENLSKFAIRAIGEKKFDLAILLIKSFDPFDELEMDNLADIAKAFIFAKQNDKALKIVRMLEDNPMQDEKADKALLKIAKRSLYTPGAEHIAYEVANKRHNITYKIQTIIDSKNISFDYKIWNAKIAFMSKKDEELKKEIYPIINSFDPTKKEEAKKLEIIAKTALRAKQFEIVIDIMYKLEIDKENNKDELANIAKTALHVHGALPIAVEIADSLGDDEQAKKIKELVARNIDENN